MDEELPLLRHRGRLVTLFRSLLSRFSQKPHFSKTRFWWFCVLGVLAIITLHLSFLPRTSLSRDFRRWHELRLTKSDVKRNYLMMASHHPASDNEAHVSGWLNMLTKANSQSPVNLVASDNSHLVLYVDRTFRQLGLTTAQFSYPVDLQAPQFPTVQLVDNSTGRVLYTAPVLESVTPAYFGFGFNGLVQAPFAAIGEGTHADYKGTEHGKVVIVQQSTNLTVAEQIYIAEKHGAAALISYTEGDAISRALAALILLQCAMPALPLSQKALQPVLDALKESGGGGLVLRVTTPFSHTSRHLTNVVGELKGVLNDGVIIIGASRDSFTSTNPLSGHAIMFEIIRHFQQLLRLGWKPLRNIRFVSFDASRNGLLGAQHALNDTDFLASNMPVVAYINIDGDAVTGSRFRVDLSPLFNHLLVKTARFVPMPRNSNPFKTLPSGDDEWSTLLKYWRKQDNSSINNLLGPQIGHSDAFVFENSGAPVINVKFENDPRREDPVYVPNSESYSYDWLVKQHVDEHWLLHQTLVRFLGLFAITLSEHEVVNTKMLPYAAQLENYLSELEEDHADQLGAWAHRNVSLYLINKHAIYNEVKGDDDAEVTFGDLIRQLTKLFESFVEQAKVFDDYLKQVEDQWTQDYPWYSLIKKVHIYAKLKVANYKLLRVEQELLLKERDHQYLKSGKTTYLQHVVFGVPRFIPTATSADLGTRGDRAAFPHLHDALDAGDLESAIKWVTLTFEKVNNLLKKIS